MHDPLAIPLRIAVLAVLGVAAACSPQTGASPSSDPTPGAADPIRVEVVRPLRNAMVRRLEVVASLEPWEQVVLYAKASGYLRSIRVDRGDRVARGNLIAELDIPEMVDELEQLESRERQAEAEIEKARADVRLLEITARRLEAIRDEEPGAVTAQELDLASGKLEAAQAALAAEESRLGMVRADVARLRTMREYARISAPFAGVVTERFVDPGALITAGTQSKPTPIVRIMDDSRLRAMVDVPERDVAGLAIGLPARLRAEAHPGRTFEGTVSRFSRALDPGSRTMRTEILIDNEQAALCAGMFGRISLDLERRENILTVPPAVLRFEKDQPYLFVADDDHARRVEVTTGEDDGTVVEIVSGLTGEEWIILKASTPLSDGATIGITRPDGTVGGES